MITKSVISIVGTPNVPPCLRSLSSLSGIDYADQFTLTTEVDATAEQWARAMFGDVPSAMGRLIWAGPLGLRLARVRSPVTVAGWRVTGRHDEWVRLEAASRFLTGNLIVQAADRRVSLATFFHYDGRLGRVVWPPLSALHRRLAPALLRRTEATLQAREQAD